MRTNPYLIEYYNAIHRGEIVAGQELIATLEKLISDLDNPDYIYDTSTANKRIAFIENKCKHTKSPFYGKPFILELWEKAFIEVVYSFKSARTGFRRFKKVLLMIGRKNGKTTLCAAISNAEFFCGCGGNDLICSSNDDAQASIIFDEIANMRELIDRKKKITHKNLKGMFHLRKKSTVKKLSDRTRNKEGRNIDIATVDEIHEMRDNTISKSIEQSQSTKDEPLMIEITTEGFVNDGYLDNRLKYARGVLKGEIEDDSFLPWLYTQDSENEIWQNPRSWQKSNPSLGIVKKVEYLEREILAAQNSNADKVFMLCKDFNIHQNSSAAWLMESDIESVETIDLEQFRGAVVIGANDLSDTTDLTTASILMFKRGENKKYFHCHYFIPETKLEQKYDDMDYAEMAKQGKLTIVPGNEMDYSYLTKWYMELYAKYNIKLFKCAYDNWHAKYWVNEMHDTFTKGLCERVNFEKTAISPAMKLVEDDLRRKNINYGNNELTKWCLKNTAIKVDNLMQIMPVKINDQSNRRIDGAVTLILAYAVYLRFRNEFLQYV